MADKKMKLLQARVPEKTYREVQREAARRGLSIAALVREHLIRVYVESRAVRSFL